MDDLATQRATTYLKGIQLETFASQQEGQARAKKAKAALIQVSAQQKLAEAAVHASEAARSQGLVPRLARLIQMGEAALSARFQYGNAVAYQKGASRAMARAQSARARLTN